MPTLYFKRQKEPMMISTFSGHNSKEKLGLRVFQKSRSGTQILAATAT